MSALPSPPDQRSAEALDLLRRVPYGRAAVSLNALPRVLPARHLVRDGDVLFRTNYGMDDDRLLDGTVVAYEVNTQGLAGSEEGLVGWSAQLVGFAHTYEPTAEERRHFGPQPVFEDGCDTSVHIRMTPRFVTVRRACHRAPR